MIGVDVGILLLVTTHVATGLELEALQTRVTMMWSWAIAALMAASRCVHCGDSRAVLPLEGVMSSGALVVATICSAVGNSHAS